MSRCAKKPHFNFYQALPWIILLRDGQRRANSWRQGPRQVMVPVLSALPLHFHGQEPCCNCKPCFFPVCLERNTQPPFTFESPFTYFSQFLGFFKVRHHSFHCLSSLLFLFYTVPSWHCPSCFHPVTWDLHLSGSHIHVPVLIKHALSA